MSLTTNSNINYNDFDSLSRLRSEARNDSQAALKEVAQQFESVFVQMMIKTMREASVPLQGDLFHSDQTKAYTEMYDKQLGLELSQSNGIGLADVIMRQLSSTQNIKDQNNSGAALSFINNNRGATPASAQKQNIAAIATAAKADAQAIDVQTVQNKTGMALENRQQPARWHTPEDFIRDSWPHAQRAGEALGVDPRVILAQSALETGWGKKVHFNAEGENSYCLFGIKAGNNWQGKSVSFNTLEFRSGSMNRETASFRAYDSLSESYQDYVKFLNHNPRYQNVLNADSSKEYALELQKAGYATDPNYSNKIERIRQGDLLNKVVSELQLSSTEPLT
ncbi:MAG: flagellar assembly peptidoglycan hydrolase FlgJ [Gammaproteobacteria bacterium]|nr:flagellar assembly peptidoglycan hydrolase FlgJ [Gammaproteobacteria bacterium]